MPRTRRVNIPAPPGAPSWPRPGALALALVIAPVAIADDFAVSVVGYTPAPGQFVNSPMYNNPARALGPPVGGGTLTPDNSKLVTLGGFGGSITLRFDPPVLDDPANPYGLDAIVYGNAHYAGGNPNRRFAEAGVIEISRDVNANGLPDDPWYIVSGSHLPVPATNAAQTQTWDHDPGTPLPPANLAWYPAPPRYIGWPPSYVTAGFRLPPMFEAQVVTNPNGLTATLEGAHAYADFTPTLILGDTDADNTVDQPGVSPSDFYTSPDNPFVVGVSPGSGGGDGFDIRWAVRADTGTPARLDAFDFIRISTGVNFVAGPLGELSTEVGAVARVRAAPAFFDLTSDGAVDAEDLYRWHGSASGAADFTGEGAANTDDADMLARCVRRSEREDLEAAR